MKLLCIGHDGQLARALFEQASTLGIDLVARGRPSIDLLSPDSVERALMEVGPSVVINTAAYTHVDGAEQDAASAYALNQAAAETLAAATANRSIPLIHVSTDYVFDGTSPAPYLETAPAAPSGIYGASKLAGERAVAAANPQHVILRTAWLYSPFGQNFLKTMLRLAERDVAIRVVNDQFGSPTSALDLAAAILQICERIDASPKAPFWGVFHATALGETHWAEFAKVIFKHSAAMNGPSAKVAEIPSSAYPTPVKRPANSSLCCDKLLSVFGISLPQWQKSVAAIVARVLDEKERS